MWGDSAGCAGSSPRGRGKRSRGRPVRGRARLIPARAGKTELLEHDPPAPAAHPRAGGENSVTSTSVFCDPGSSPRGRGKHGLAVGRVLKRRLIPARAGKTWVAHSGNCMWGGSSPRGRGKPSGPAYHRSATRLIPARAGKTRLSRGRSLARRAHPRAGGENHLSHHETSSLTGSSPRGRGKPSPPDEGGAAGGLIPARAGKTLAACSSTPPRRAHPRAGGENALSDMGAYTGNGSSPRGRGKHFLTCAFIKRIGQILETLELAVSSESYSLCDVYATDAPQDQARNTGLALPSSRAAS